MAESIENDGSAERGRIPDPIYQSLTKPKTGQERTAAARLVYAARELQACAGEKDILMPLLTGALGVSAFTGGSILGAVEPTATGRAISWGVAAVGAATAVTSAYKAQKSAKESLTAPVTSAVAAFSRATTLWEIAAGVSENRGEYVALDLLRASISKEGNAQLERFVPPLDRFTGKAL